MNMYETFLNYFNDLCSKTHIDLNDMPIEVKEVLDIIKTQSNEIENKPEFTDIGLQVVEYMQSCNTLNLKAKDIADGLNISSRVVSGAMRKLANDKYIIKFGNNPVVYNLTEKGKNVNIDEQKNKLNNKEK